MPAPIGIVTGLRFEADILCAAVRKVPIADRVQILASGPGRARAQAAARTLIGEGARLILSMGLAGGLDPALAPGAVILPEATRDTEGRHLPADPDHRHIVHETLATRGRLSGGLIVDVEAPVTSRAAKEALYRETGAVAVDMESFGAFDAAYTAGVPALALRIVADHAFQEIPAAALEGMTEDGSIAPLRVIKSALAAPQQIPALIALGRQSRHARYVLGRLGELFLARLVLMDL